MMFSNGFGHFNNYHTQPAYFSLQDLRDEDEIIQVSPLLRLQDSLLDIIVEYVPLKDRLVNLRPVCHRLSNSVKRSVKSIEYLRDELDYCDDAKISFFLSVYGKNIVRMNYDLFRSCSLREYTQWSWRQSVISSVIRCTQLKHLDILICCRHRLRDGDLQVIFKNCNQLEVLRMDASYINGHCFGNAPQTMHKVELECCQRLNKRGFLLMCSRLHRLQTLHVSLIQCIDEQVIKRIGDMKKLRNLSIIANPEEKMNNFRLAEIRRLPRLSTLCLDGLNNVTDKFLHDLCDSSESPASATIEHLSIAFCMNVGSNGIAKLKNLPNLKSLNLDGVNKRDISIGLEAISQAGKLERLMVSEDAFVSPKTIVELVAKCDSLRTLDICRNHRLQDEVFAEKLFKARSFSSGKPLVILADFKSMWRRLPPFSYLNRVEVVIVNDQNPEEHLESISINSVQQISRGHLVPDLRRGNRYKMFDYSLNTSGEESVDLENCEKQELENQSPVDSISGPLSALTEKEHEDLANLLMGMRQQFQSSEWLDNQCSFHAAPLQLTSTDFENRITVGSAGAPGPAKERGCDRILKHSRPSRPRRQAQKDRANERRSGVSNAQQVIPTGPSFTDDDFPPLG